MMSSYEKIKSLVNQGKHICVGLDSDVEKIPEHLKKLSDPVFEFNKIVIENTAEDAAAYKINFAFYEKDGAKGFEEIQKTLELIPKNILTIADAKRGDIGNTSQMYAQSVYEHFNFDSVTLHPYMGFDSLEPFLDYKDKLNFILALTSNKGSADFEKLKLDDGTSLYQKVIEKVKSWNGAHNCGIVFGATNADELKENVKSFGDLIVLLPGIGAQGGSLEEVVSAFNQNDNKNFLINVSRALIYCDGSKDFASKINSTIKELNKSIKK